MKFWISLFSVCILSFILVFSCSTEEVQDTTPPPSIIQTPQPETPAAIQYTLTVSSGDGGTVSSEGGTYDEGTDITLTATPNGEFVFSNWSNGSTDNPISFKLNSDTNLTANFEKRKYALTINISGEGTVTEEIIETGKSTDYDSGTKVKLTAVPSEGWVFRSWGELIENQELSFEIIIDEPKEVNVVFDEFVEEGYFSIRFEGNGVYQRPNSPYPPLEYQIELISGNKNQSGHFSEGSTLRFTYIENPGWLLAKEYNKEYYTEVPRMSVINDYEPSKWSDILSGNNFTITENIIIPINVSGCGNIFNTDDNFPWDEIDSNGDYLNVGYNIGAYSEWNEPNSEINWYVTDGFSWPGYVEAYKNNLFEILQVVGNIGPLDMLIFDFEANPTNNREMYRKTCIKRNLKQYNNQLTSRIDISEDMERYDRIVSEGGYAFGSAAASMGGTKQVGEINKQSEPERGLQEYLIRWADALGVDTGQLMQSDTFHWDWVFVHEPLHIWQVSHEKHGFWNDIGGDLYRRHHQIISNPSYLNKIAPRWYFEGHIIVLEEIWRDKMQYRQPELEYFPYFEHYNGIELPEIDGDIRWTLKNRIFRLINEYQNETNQSINRLSRHEWLNFDYNSYIETLDIEQTGFIYDQVPKPHYFNLGILASHYMLVKMNFNFDSYLEFDVVRGAQGFDVAIQQFLGLTEQQFYNEFNTWFFDSGLTDDQKIDYLWPEGTDPIQIDIQSRR
jgi:hypothetical protein